ncbi:MAG: hypothetical protein IKP71_00020 [Candidatus Riflebacteria bacterium]|nr:hypothetical protein [Candidatus Riflebacteria bacterium]
MNFKKILIASCILLTTNAVLADVTVPYGEGSGKVDFINNKRFPKLEDPLPVGPLAFRMIEDKVWIADSVGGKLMQLDQNGKILSEISVLSEGTKPYKIDEYNNPVLNIQIEDIAAVRGDYGAVSAWWIIDSLGNRLMKFGLDGKKLAEIKSPDFKQLYRLEVGIGGHVFVADKVAKAIFIYDSAGKFINKQHWEWSGMAVAGTDEKLYRLMYVGEEQKNVLVSTNLEGKVIKTVMLDVVNMLNPKLWWVDEVKGECVLTCTPNTGYKGIFNIYRIGLDGKVKAKGELKAPYFMNRFIDNIDFEGVYIGKADYSKAPEGKLEIVPFSMPK